jgi:hypothetical protein
VKERRRGPIGRATGIAEGVAAAVRRYQRGREPRALLYAIGGGGRLVRPSAPGYDRLMDAAERMIALVDLPVEDPVARPDDPSPASQ